MHCHADPSCTWNCGQTNPWLCWLLHAAVTSQVDSASRRPELCDRHLQCSEALLISLAVPVRFVGILRIRVSPWLSRLFLPRVSGRKLTAQGRKAVSQHSSPGIKLPLGTRTRTPGPAERLPGFLLGLAWSSFGPHSDLCLVFPGDTLFMSHSCLGGEVMHREPRGG